MLGIGDFLCVCVGGGVKLRVGIRGGSNGEYALGHIVYIITRLQVYVWCTFSPKSLLIFFCWAGKNQKSAHLWGKKCMYAYG